MFVLCKFGFMCDMIPTKYRPNIKISRCRVYSRILGKALLKTERTLRWFKTPQPSEQSWCGALSIPSVLGTAK